MRMHLHSMRWLGAVGAVLVTPVVLSLLGPRAQRDVWTEVSVGLGFVGLAFLIVQFLSTMRTRRLTNRVGYAEALRFHRSAAIVGLVLIIAHPVILFVTDPADRLLLNPASVPLRAWFGYAALAGLLALVGLSLGRARLRIRYELWKTTPRTCRPGRRCAWTGPTAPSAPTRRTPAGSCSSPGASVSPRS